MGLYEGFSAVGSSVTNIQALSAWAHSVSDAVDAGVPTDDAFGLLKATGVPLSSPLGKWMEQVSETAEATPPSGGVGIFDTLRDAAMIPIGAALAPALLFALITTLFALAADEF